jgi:hypothetical protein
MPVKTVILLSIDEYERLQQIEKKYLKLSNTQKAPQMTSSTPESLEGKGSTMDPCRKGNEAQSCLPTTVTSNFLPPAVAPIIFSTSLPENPQKVNPDPVLQPGLTEQLTVSEAHGNPDGEEGPPSKAPKEGTSVTRPWYFIGLQDSSDSE